MVLDPLELVLGPKLGSFARAVCALLNQLVYVCVCAYMSLHVLCANMFPQSP